MDEPKIQLVIPMAGRGTRFVEAGYETPKPLLPIHDIPMFQVVLGNLLTPQVNRVVIVARHEFNIRSLVETLSASTGVQMDLIEIDYTTGGPADSVELALPHLDLRLPVVTANSDQYVDFNVFDFYTEILRLGLDGSILTMQDSDPKWSYARIEDGLVAEVREKEVISSFATVGIYGFRSAELLKRAFDLMRAADARVNGEFYVAPAYNELVARNGRITAHDLGPVATVMYGLGTPSDYELFLGTRVSHAAAEAGRSLAKKL